MDLTEPWQLESLYWRSLSRGELLLPAEDCLAVGKPIDLEIALLDALSVSLQARVTEVVEEPDRTVKLSFDPMSKFEFDAIFSLLRETEAAQTAKSAACSATARGEPPARLADGTNAGIEAFTRSTQRVSPEHQARLRLEMALALARDELSDGLIDQAGVRFERALEMSPECREAVEGLVEVARRRRDTQAGRLDSLLGRR